MCWSLCQIAPGTIANHSTICRIGYNAVEDVAFPPQVFTFCVYVQLFNDAINMYNFLMTLILNSCFPMKRKGNSERKQWGDGNNEKEKKNQINIACINKLWKQKV